jgi:hypothetical protein
MSTSRIGFGISVRILTAAILLLWRLDWMAAAFSTPCLAIAVASGLQECLDWIVIIILGVVVTFYTMVGGIRAVMFFILLPAVGYLLATLVSRLATYTSDQVMVQRF